LFKLLSLKKLKQSVFFAILFSFILFNSLNAHAHSSGHYTSKNELNAWLLSNGTIIKGNFLKAEDAAIILEQLEGKQITIPIELLSLQDQKLARLKIKKYNEINQQNETVETTTSFARFEYEQIIIVLISAVILLLSRIIFKFIISKKYQSLQSIQYGFLSIVITLGLFSFNNADNIFHLFIPKTKPSFLDSAFNPYKTKVTTRWDEKYYYISSDGIPNHNMMEGITRWQQQVPIPQNYAENNSWMIPLQPVFATTNLSTKNNFMRGAIAIAVNGVPIFNALNNRGEDAYLIGELDKWGGHCGRADDYHYHIAPLHLSNNSGLKPIAFALDGFAVYGLKEPDGKPMNPLDECHGHIGSNGLYHYHGTNTYPYLIGAMKGEVNIDSSKPAPENQIVQPFATPIRPALKALHDASITNFSSSGINAYTLTYQINNKEGKVQYNWDAANNYYFNFIDINGNKTSETFQRRKRNPNKPNK
jgi:hypothetical protein